MTIFRSLEQRRSALDRSFNAQYLLDTTQAVYDQRGSQGIDGLLCLGMQTQALSVLAAVATPMCLTAHAAKLPLADASCAPRYLAALEQIVRRQAETRLGCARLACRTIVLVANQT